MAKPALGTTDAAPFKEPMSTERRRLLRAAAAAPFVATLPGGAAYAMASASQCVIDSKTSSELCNPILSEGTPDKWVRRPAITQRFGSFQGGTPQIKDYWKLDGVWYDEDGHVVTPNFDPSCDPNAEFCPVGPEETAYVLQIYRPDYAATGDPNFPNGVHPVGSYPKDSLQCDRPTAPAENMGITATCLCSVDPNFAGPGYC